MITAPQNYIANVTQPSPITGIGRFYTGPDTVTTQFDNIFTMIITFLTIVGGLTFLIYFIIGGLSWISAGGDAKKVDTAKSYLTNGAIGMIVIVASYSIIWVVSEVLGLNILQPGLTITTLFGQSPK